LNTQSQLQTLAARRSTLARLTLSLVNKAGPLTPEDRKKLAGIRDEMDVLEGDLRTEAQKRFAKAFSNYLRHGWAPSQRFGGISSEDREMITEAQRVEFRDLGTLNEGAYPGATGGFFAPLLFSGQVESAEKWYSALLDAATIWDTSTGAPLSYPMDDDATITGELIPENSQVTTADDAPLSSVNLKGYLFSSRMVKVSIALLQDAGFPLDLYLATRLGIRLGRVSNSYFVRGTGQSQPTGIVTAAGTTIIANGSYSTDGTGGANSIGSDDLASLEAAVDAAYRVPAQGAAFMMHQNTLSALRQVKDKAGRPLRLVSEAGTILGYPARVNNALDQLQSASSSPAVTCDTVVFGALKKYTIRRAPLRVMRIEERYAEQGQVAYIAFRRMDGNLVDGCAGASCAVLQNVF